MEKLYETLGDWSPETKEKVWRGWLWETNCVAPPLDQCCDMNQMHVLGILCCLAEEACCEDMRMMIGPGLLPSVPLVHLYPHIPISQLSLRQLFDQIECLQLHWGPVLSSFGRPHEEEKEGVILKILKALMARLGVIAHHAYSEESEVLDDPQHITPLPHHEEQTPLFVISRKSLRKAICVLFSLTRVYEIVFVKSEPVHEPLPDKEAKAIISALRQHHLEASGDLFTDLQQMVHLAPGMRLVYRTNFAGMYNHVSQVVYFHYPRFCKKAQLPLQDIPSSPLHMLPPITQLIPDVPIFYDDDGVIPGLTLFSTSTNKNHKWIWLACCGAFFLVDVCEKRVFSGSSLVPLVAHFLRATGRSLVSVAEGAAFVKGEPCAPHAHVELSSTTT